MRGLQSIAAAFIVFVSSIAHAELRTVDQVDVGRYVGVWYQIANIPQIFEGGTCVCARQELTLREDKTVGVYNSCNADNPQGHRREIRGTAYNEDPKTNAKFSVDFGLPWRGTYWIIGLDKDYRYAVVSDRHERTLYILSKTPTLDQALYDEAVAEAAKQLDTSKLKITLQEGCQYPSGNK